VRLGKVGNGGRIIEDRREYIREEREVKSNCDVISAVKLKSTVIVSTKSLNKLFKKGT